MPKRTTVTFRVTPGRSVVAYWIAVGDNDVPLENKEGEIALPAGRHFLTWWFLGESGGTLSISGRDNRREVVTVKNSKIPKGETEGAGAKRFTV